MSSSKQPEFECVNGHVFEPSIFGVAQCPHCGTSNFWPKDKKKSKSGLIVLIASTILLGAGGLGAWYMGWIPGGSGDVFLHAQTDPNDPCMFYLEVLREDSSKVTDTYFWYKRGAEKAVNQTSFCWSEGGNATFTAVAKDAEMFQFLPGGETLKLNAPGSTKLEDCPCYGPGPGVDSTNICKPCDFDPINSEYSINDVTFDCNGPTPVFVFDFNREDCPDCNLKWYVKRGDGDWQLGNTLDATGMSEYDLYATYGETPDDNPPVEFTNNGALCEVPDCNAQSLPTRVDIETDLPGRLNNLIRSTQDESVERFTIAGKGQVIIPPERVLFKRNGKVMSYRQFQNDLMMLGGKVTRVTVKTTGAGYATEVTELQVTVQ